MCAGLTYIYYITYIRTVEHVTYTIYRLSAYDDCLTSLRGLLILRLCSNEISEAGAAALAEGLRHGRLQQLVAGGNAFRAHGATALASALRENQQLQVLDAAGVRGITLDIFI